MRRTFPINPDRGLSAQIPAGIFDGWPCGVVKVGHWEMESEAGVLYRFHGDTDLLYVGITGTSVAARWGAHRGSEWWPLVRSVTVEPSSPDRGEALEIERAAILAERPRFNVIHLRRLKVLSVRLDEGPDAVVAQFRRKLLPEDFAALVAAFSNPTGA